MALLLDNGPHEVSMMQVRDEDPAAPPAAPEEAPDAPLTERRSMLQRLLEEMVLSQVDLPATQEFLVARGLISVDQLDNAGRADLLTHIESAVRALYFAGHIT